MKLKDGRTRMYLPSPTLSQVTAGPSPIWPYADSAGIAKFGIEAGRRIEDLAGQMAWWRAGSHALAVTRVESLHFSSHFIAFMDSTDGLNWTLYAPKVPMEVDEHDECKQNADPIFEDGGFRAGWRSTSIRCSGSDVVYRDPSVIYLEKIDRYVMFVVECAAERSPPDYFVPVGDYVPPSAPPWAHAAAIDDNNRCQICLGECVLLDGTYVKFKTTTRVVFFVCSNPDFQHGVLGPFRASEDLQTASRLESDAEAEQPYAPKFIGVPQAFLDPDEANFFLFYANPTLPAGSTGMHVAPISAVARQVAQLERDWFQGGSARRAALNSDTFRQMLTVLGDPTPIVGNTYLITDQHFYFCNNHLQMMGGQNYVAQPNDPRLTELWQFSFTEEYVSQKIFLSGLPPSG
ncbi:MAG TPA: hypothetical protein PLA94_25835, partial [Myxococcota bacterium]|nr:hypothetical protein [Myxococcota bacterium]